MNSLQNSLQNPLQNRLLAALPSADWARWQPHLEPVVLAHDQVLFESGGKPASVVFPGTAVVSLSFMTREGGSAEVAVVGNEGMVGISLVMGGAAMPGRAVVQNAGYGWRLSASKIEAAVERGGAVLELLLLYTQSLLMQAAQTAACNRHHSIAQQFSRRLLMGLDRSQSDEVAMTQEAAALMLGVRRESVTAEALKLQQAGLIRYRRGHIAVLDRQRLEQHSCECYSVAKRAHERLLPMPMPMPMAA
jgi:CRP-like cAMP-binding protein